MFKNISSTQTANYVAIVMFVTEFAKFNITESEIETLVKGLIGVGAVIYTIYTRYKVGDLTKLGGRKVV